MALAYFISFTTYGTWLPGSGKGSGSVDRAHNAYGSPFVPPDPAREQRAACRMTEPPYTLDERARTIVRDAIVGFCVEKNWTLLALHVRSNHVHSVISAEREPGRLMSDLKARASRELNRAGVDDRTKRWTRHGSTRHLFEEASVKAAVNYTLDEQGPPMAVYDPRTPRPAHEAPKRTSHEAQKRAAHEVSAPQSTSHEVSGNADTTKNHARNDETTHPSNTADPSASGTTNPLGNPLTSCAAPSPADDSCAPLLCDSCAASSPADHVLGDHQHPKGLEDA